MPDRIEYPDEAGYPDGKGFLDEGTAVLDDPAVQAAAAELTLPRSDRDAELVIREHVEESRFVLTLRELSGPEQEIGRMPYDRDAQRRTLKSVFVEPPFRDRGIGTAFIAHVLDELREQGASITIGCPEVADFVRDNPGYADLVDAEHPGLRA